MKTKIKCISLPVMKPLSCWLKTVLPVLITGGVLSPLHAIADNYYFDPSLLETTKSGQKASDLSAFSGKNTHSPGDYDVEIVINKKKVTQRKITFAIDDNGEIRPQLTVGLLRELGFKVDEINSLNTLDDNALITDLSKTVPGSKTKIDLNHSTLILDIPQIALRHDPSGYVDPARWDHGIPVLFTNYSFSGSNSYYSNSEKNERFYLNMQNGVNIGPWRLRNYSTWTHSSNETRWDSINSWLQRDIKSLKSQLVLGESATDGTIFSSVQFTGARIYSDENMLPNSLRGFAPIIRGIANTSAIVTIRQNGYTIYQSNVPAGAFEINDLYPSSFSGDLDVTIEEADGTVRQFTQPFSALPVMQRPGHLLYSMTAGRFRADPSSNSKEPEFIEGTAFYGLTNIFTLYGGVTGSKDYQAAALGIGSTLSILGALSVDLTYAKTKLENKEKFTGEGLRFQYIKDIPETGTSLSLSYSRYSNSGFFTFADANQRDINVNNRQRSEAIFNVNQTLTDNLSFLYFRCTTRILGSRTK
ncbi:putative outer membrane protein [Escherichia coli TA255]|nr:putative outer membrane protein [Escherichia coli TA255]